MSAPADYVVRVLHGYLYNRYTGEVTHKRIWAERFTKADAERFGKAMGGYYEVEKW